MLINTFGIWKHCLIFKKLKLYYIANCVLFSSTAGLGDLEDDLQGESSGDLKCLLTGLVQVSGNLYFV